MKSEEYKTYYEQTSILAGDGMETKNYYVISSHLLFAALMDDIECDILEVECFLNIHIPMSGSTDIFFHDLSDEEFSQTIFTAAEVGKLNKLIDEADLSIIDTSKFSAYLTSARNAVEDRLGRWSKSFKGWERAV